MPKVDLRGLELTTMGTSGQGRILDDDSTVLRDECPRGGTPDTDVAATVGRLLGWTEDRIDSAIDDGLQRGLFRPRD